MTLTQILKQSGKFFKYKDASKIGHLIHDTAIEKGIKWSKTEEVVTVNDYPEEFAEEMKRIISEYFQKKSEITKRVMAEMRKEEVKPNNIPTEKEPRKRIIVKKVADTKKEK